MPYHVGLCLVPLCMQCLLVCRPPITPQAGGNLSNDYQLCTQDFEALTPNLLARTIETVEGGGIVVLLLSTLTSLTQLFSLTMDVHSRLRTESHQDVTGECPSLCSFCWQLPVQGGQAGWFCEQHATAAAAQATCIFKAQHIKAHMQLIISQQKFRKPAG